MPRAKKKEIEVGKDFQAILEFAEGPSAGMKIKVLRKKRTEQAKKEGNV